MKPIFTNLLITSSAKRIVVTSTLLLLTILHSNGSTVGADFSVDKAAPVAIAVGEEVTFTDKSTNATSWKWSFGSDANPATANTQGSHKVSYSTAGNKTVSLTASNGNDSDTKTMVITVYDEHSFYSYKSGDWNDANTWTQDPSGSLSVNPKVPGEHDIVTILNGRDIYIAQNTKKVFSLDIQDGASLDIRATTGHNFGNVSGQGAMRLQTNSFPGGIFSEFVSANGGTVEYYNPNADFTLAQLEYNNLIFNFNNTSRIVTLAGNLTVNGNLNINRGIFQIGNNSTSRTAQIYGNVLVESTGRIQLATNNANHRFIVNGDFTNYGEVRFTSQTSPNYTGNLNYSRADVVFNNKSADQNLLIGGVSIFHRIEIDKGIDQTFVLNIDATDPKHFKLYGRNNQDPGDNAPNISNQHALGLLAGTVRLGENIVIPSLATGTTYTVDEDAMLWLDGANVTFGTGTTADGTTLLLYGSLKVTGNSILNDNSKQGIVSRTTASIIIEGGEISTECIRTSYQSGVHRGAFNMSGGALTIRAVNLPNLGGMNVYAAMTLPYPDNTINISGGEINILSPTTLSGGPGSNFSILIGANPNNINISGGVFNVTVPTSRDVYILSTAPFWDLNIISTVNSRSAQPQAYTNNSTIPGIAVQPLVVQNNLTLINRAILTSGNANANVTVGGNFTINNNTTYTPGSNTTIFNGNGPQAFTNNGTITSGLYNLELAGKADLTLDGAATYTVRSGLSLGKGTTLRDNGRTITVAGNVYNSGTHFRPVSGAGRIELTGSSAQVISGDGNGVFNNLSVTKSGGSVTMSAGMTINGNLRLVNNHPLNIGNNVLKFGAEGNIFSAATGTAQTFASNKMIVTGGLMSDGGVQKQFSNTDAFLYPFGVGSNYLPATIKFNSAPTEYGTVTSRPVNGRHHLAQGTNNALTGYWKTTSNGFTGIVANSVVHTYSYVQSMVQGTENDYRPAVYNYGTSWRVLDDANLVNPATNVINFNAESSANGDYTAGLPAAFNNIPVLYSISSGDWNSTSTWSTTGHDGSAGTVTPSAGTIVIIGNTHTVTMTANNATAGALFISDGGTLDLVSTTGHNFAALPEESVGGSGTLRIASSYFPRGDFGEFLGENGGTVEYYVSGNNSYTIHTSSDVTGISLNHYRNLIINASGANITLPNTDFTVYENLTIKGANTVITNTNNSRSYTVKGNLNIDAGGLQYYNAVATHITVLGDLIIKSGASFNVRDGGTTVANTLNLYGNMTNNGTFSMRNGTRYVSTYFKGETDAVIDGSGTTTHFNNLYVDKGSDATPVLTLKSSITSAVSNPFLTLLNGTFRVDNSSLTVTVTDGSTDFTIPATAALSVNAGTVRVGYGDGNANLLLVGKLEVLGGSMEVGQSTYNRNNSIEYAPAGKPEIYVSGGVLYVYGQVRRSSTTTSGSLNYVQSGGDVTIAGRNRMVTRGLFEVLNTGSLFSTSGGTLNLVRPSAVGTSFGDLLIRPEAHDVTGGTIQLGVDGNSANYSFVVQSSTPVWNMTVGANTGQTASLAVLPLVVKNTLTVSGSSMFKANGLDVDIAGNLINNNISSNRGLDEGGFRPGSSTQVTRFNGATQSIQGVGVNVTNFANLEFSSTNLTLASNSSIYVNNNLSILSGKVTDGGNIIAVAGNINNVATHISGSLAGGISLEGNKAQTISGNNGVFGNILMNNNSGAVAVNNLRINGRLTFTAGSFYINDYMLTFGENASIGGTPDNRRMVMLNGVLSDQGVRKMYSSGASAEFVFPIGVQGKYTPAAYTMISNGSAGSITIRPINDKHPALNDTDVNELSYYWSVKSSGLSNPSVVHKYTYHEDDVHAVEAQYVGGRYDYENYTWYYVADAVDANANTISFNGDFITGEYTAGYSTNFVTRPTLYSRATGNWNSGNTWSSTPGGDASGLTPNGNPVVIAAGHTVTLDVNNGYTYSVKLEGTLAVGTTLYHNLGRFSGNGTLSVTSSTDGNFVLPGGSFDEFFDNAASTIEFKGTNDANLPLKPGNIYKPFQNIVLSGSGRKNVSADDMKIKGNITISSGASFSNVNNNRTIYVGGDWIDNNTTVSGFVPGRGTVIFDGNKTQNYTVKTTGTFYNVTMNSTAGVLDMVSSTANASLKVSNKLTLTKGVIKSYDNKVVYVTNTSTGAIAGGNTASYVDGPLTKSIATNQTVAFPVGNNGRYGRMSVMNVQGGTSPADWTVKYFDNNTYPQAEANLNTPVTSVSNNEHWVVTRPTGASANIQLRWDDRSYPGATSDASLRNSLRVVQYENGSQKWSERGQTVNASAKTVSTTTRVTTNDYIFTLGLSGVTATITDNTPVEICNNGEVASIPVTLTGTAPWTLTYRVGTRNFTQTGITSANYVIQITGADLDGAGTYPVSLVSVSDRTNAGVAISGSVNLVVKQTYMPVVNGAAIVGSSETRSYSTPQNGSNTYVWSWVGTSGGTISSPTSASTNIVFGNTIGIYQLQVVETTASTGCVASTVFTIEITNVPVPDITPKEANICIGSTVTYSTTAITGNQYRWTVTGGTIQTANATDWRASGNTVTVLWNTSGDGSIKVEERVASTSVQGEYSLAVLVSPAVSSRTISLVSSTVCEGVDAQVKVANSEVGTSYRLVNAADNSTMGIPVAGNGSEITINSGSLSSSQSPYTIIVEGFNLGCSLELGRVTVTVQPAPVAALVSNATGDAFCYGTSVLFTADAGYNNYIFVVDGLGVQNGTSNSYSTTSLNNGSEVYVEVTNSNGCVGGSNNLIMSTLTTPGLWTGAVDGEWGNPFNWCSCELPSGGDITIQSTTNAPSVPAGNDVLVVNNLTINSNTLTVKPGAKMTVNGNIDISGTGALVIENNLNGLTGASGTDIEPASFINHGNINGSVTIRTNFPVLPRNWYLGMPVAGNSSAYKIVSGKSFSMWTYNHANNKEEWQVVTNGTTLQNNMTAYVINNGTGAPQRVDVVGTLVNSTQTMAMSVDAKNGFNLVANPFTAYMDPAQLNLGLDGDGKGMEPTIWYRTVNSEHYYAFETLNKAEWISLPAGNSKLIAPMQGFWVRARSEGQVLSMSKSMLQHTTANNHQLKSMQVPDADVLYLELSNSKTSDQLAIAMRASGNDSYSNNDSEKRLSAGSVPDFYSVKSGKYVAINIVPDAPATTTVNLGCNLANGANSNLKISALNLSSFMAGTEVFLEDKLTGDVVNLRNNGEYSFESTTGAINNRFVLTFSRVSTDIDNNVTAGKPTIRIYGNDGKAIVNIDSELLVDGGNIRVFTLSGALVSIHKVSDTRSEISLPDASAIYVVEAEAGGVVKREKIVK